MNRTEQSQIRKQEGFSLKYKYTYQTDRIRNKGLVPSSAEVNKAPYHYQRTYAGLLIQLMKNVYYLSCLRANQ